jgi:NAD+ diphosphatase
MDMRLSGAVGTGPTALRPGPTALDARRPASYRDVVSEPNWFTGSPLDRASARRGDEAWLATQLAAPGSRFLLLHRLRPLLRGDDVLAIAWARSDVRELAAVGSDPILLGLDGDVACYAVDVSDLEKPERELGVVGIAEFHELRAAAARISPADAAILAQARALLDWHARHRFCASCGGPTVQRRAGSHRWCAPCEREHFPRVDPVVIALVEHEDRCLLGCQPTWPAGMYSAPAGFLEAGETIEEAVRREILEETGIRVGQVRYHSAQPWPFPSSLMIGCLGEALSSEITLDHQELADARWFSRDDLRAALEAPGRGGGFFVPGRISIAHSLIRAWLSGASARG